MQSNGGNAEQAMQDEEDEELTELEKKYREVKQDHRWYRERLLEMVEEGDKETGPWDEYRERMWETGKEANRLHRLMEKENGT